MNILDAMPSAVEFQTPAILIAKATAAIAAGGVASLLLLRSAASVRHWCWFLGLCAMLAVGAMSVVLPAWRVLPTNVAPIAARVAPLAQAPFAQTPPAPVSAMSATASSAPVQRQNDKPAAAAPIAQVSASHPANQDNRPHVAPAEIQHFVTWPTIVLAVWLLGAAIAFLPTIIATIALWRLQRRSVPLVGDDWQDLLASAAQTMGLRRRVGLLQAQSVRMPMTWGILRPKILVGADASAWPRRRQRAVLLHELAHIRRRDCLTDMLSRIVCCIYWFHPLAWVALARMRDLRERACDDMVLSSGLDATRYARHLLRVAATAPAAGFTACGIPMARGRHLHGRLKAILDERKNRRPISRRGALVSATFALMAALPLAMLRAADPATAPASNPAAQIEGDVTTIDGKPVADADVALVEPRMAGGPGGPEVVAFDLLARTRTGAKGIFRLPNLPEPAEKPRLIIRATADGMAYGAAFIEARDGHPLYYDYPRRRQTDRPSIMLPPAARLVGTVVDRQGNPIADAKVFANAGVDPVTTDLQGRFVVEKMQPTALYLIDYGSIGVRHRDFVEGQVRLNNIVAGRDNPVGIVLDRGVVVQGTLSDADSGKSIKGFVVRAYFGRTGQQLAAYSDQDGHYEFRLPAGEVNLKPSPVMAPGVADANYYSLVDAQTVRLAEGDLPVRVDFQFRHGQTVSGRITGVDAKALTSLSLQAKPAPGDPQPPSNRFSASFNSDGTFSVSHIGPGRYELWVARKSTGVQSPGQYVTVPAGQDVINVTLKVPPNLAVDDEIQVRGTVRYADGSAAANARIDLRAAEWPNSDFWYDRYTWASSDGSFVFGPISSGLKWTVWARDPNGMQGAAIILGDGAKAATPVSLTLQQGATFTGRITGWGGKGLAGYEVSIRQTMRMGKSGGDRPLITTATDEQGHYTLRGFAPPSGASGFLLGCTSNDPTLRQQYSSEQYRDIDARPEVRHDGLDFELRDSFLMRTNKTK